MDDIFEQVKSYLTGLVQGSVSREEAADWATARVKYESAGYSSHGTLWAALDRSAGADLQQGLGVSAWRDRGLTILTGSEGGGSRWAIAYRLRGGR